MERTYISAVDKNNLKKNKRLHQTKQNIITIVIKLSKLKN